MLDNNFMPEKWQKLKKILPDERAQKKRGDIQFLWISPRNLSGYFSTWHIEE